MVVAVAKNKRAAPFQVQSSEEKAEIIFFFQQREFLLLVLETQAL